MKKLLSLIVVVSLAVLLVPHVFAQEAMDAEKTTTTTTDAATTAATTETTKPAAKPTFDPSTFEKRSLCVSGANRQAVADKIVCRKNAKKAAECIKVANTRHAENIRACTLHFAPKTKLQDMTLKTTNSKGMNLAKTMEKKPAEKKQ